MSNETYREEMNRNREPKKNKLTKRLLGIVVGACVFGLVAAGVFQGYVNFKMKDNTSESEVVSDEKLEDDSLAIETNMSNETGATDVSTVVENVMPAIVAINSVVSDTTYDIFGRQYENEATGSGSGIIIGQNNDEILIVTNNHVISGAKTIGIVFADDSKAYATIKGTAPYEDLAVLSVNINELQDETIKNIKIATLGNSDTTKLGEMAIAIGNALGYGQSITVGYISALNREVTIDNITLNVLQTDAAINPGNSGGALLNSKGEVIGINSVKYVDESVESVGYAIPISKAIPIINNLMNRTELKDSEKAYLGVQGKDVTDSYANRFNMPIGVYVGGVEEKSPAYDAGVKPGDIIVAVNNSKISNLTELADVLNYTKAGEMGTITVMKLINGQYEEQVLNITFGERE